MYSFPWITNSRQPYWKAANSEGGAKDYKPGIVYFGLPYTQIYSNRKYNVSKALSEKRWTDPGKGYYVLNRSKLLNGSYCGNDCSSFASISTRGMNNSGCFDSTTAIASSSDYKTITSAASLRPGDLLCDSGHHVIMFLYFADAAHTQMMMIEQGGGEAGVNTVSCSIKSISSYTGSGYKIRRLRSLG